MWTLILTLAAAFGQAVDAVPPGTSAITVHVCADPAACAPQADAFAAHCESRGLPVLDFEPVVGAAAAHADALWAFGRAMEGLRGPRPSPEDVREARRSLDELPYTLPPDDLFLVNLRIAELHLEAGREEVALQALREASSVAGRRVHDLPPLSGDALAAYLEIAETPPAGSARVRVTADVPSAVVYVDGDEQGVAPLAFSIPAGWHRISAERAGRHTAWVATLDAAPGQEIALSASLADDDGVAAYRAAVLGEIGGIPATASFPEALAAWGRENGLSWVRFASLFPAGQEPGRTPEERIVDEAGRPWDVRAVYLDTSRRRFSPHGPGPARMRLASDRERFRVGGSFGFLQLGDRAHVAVDLQGGARLSRLLGAEVRVGLAHSANAYALYPTWVDHQVYPLSLGLRVGTSRGGPYGGLAAVAIVPYALGGELRAGFDLAPGLRQRISLEARGGYTDQGFLAGGSVSLCARN